MTLNVRFSCYQRSIHSQLQLTIFSDQIYIETNIIGIYYLKTHLNKLEKIGPHICQVTNSCKKIWYVNFSSSCYFHLVNTSCMQIMVAEFYFSLACIQYTSIHLKSFKISFAKSIGYMWESKASLLVHTHCAQCCVTFLNYLAKKLARMYLQLPLRQWGAGNVLSCHWYQVVVNEFLDLVSEINKIPMWDAWLGFKYCIQNKGCNCSPKWVPPVVGVVRVSGLIPSARQLEKVVNLDENSWTNTKLIKPLFRWPCG